MTRKMIELQGAISPLEPQSMIGGISVHRSGTKFAHVAFTLAIGLQVQASPSMALTETRFHAKGDAMPKPIGKAACSSKFAKIALTPKQLKATALEIRREWMTELGMDDAEIQVHCGPNATADLDEEMEQLTAMKQLQQLNALL